MSLVVLLSVVLMACAGEPVDSVGPEAVLLEVQLLPQSITLPPGTPQQFSARGRHSDGQVIPISVRYAATGGVISTTGLYTPGDQPGQYRVIATQDAANLADTTAVTIDVAAPPPPTVTSIRLLPEAVALHPGDNASFAATAFYSDGHQEAGVVTFTATGGTIDAGGRYTAGNSAGTFRVIATQQGGSLADTATVTITVVAPTLTGVRLAPGSAALAPGDTVRFAATGLYSNGSESPIAVTYAATGGTITAAGRYTAGTTAGTYRVIATQQGGTFADTAAITIAVVTPPPPPSGTAVALVVQRLAAGTGTVLVSSAIPLAPGRLMPAQTGQLRVYVNNQEQAVYVEPLAGRHSDGSLRTVLVQFNYSLSGTTPVTGQLVFGQARGVADLARPTASRGSPAAVVLPSDPNYLVTTQLNGPTLTSAATAALSATFARYESDFAQYADAHWASGGADWSHNYYDRALVYYAFWLRTGRVEYWRRATLMALNYRQNYLEAGNYMSSPHWSQLEGLEQHYLLTGDEASRTAVGRVADVLYAFHSTLNETTDWENRIQARVLQSYLLSWRLGATSQHGYQWATLLDDGLTRILSTQQADGAYRFRDHCDMSLNYMTGTLNDVFIKYHTYYRADSRILPAIKRSIDYMWANEWVPTARAFRYITADCPSTGTPEAAPDLNNLILTGFGWYAQQTRNSVYRDRADQIFQGAVEGAAIEYTKQFNQQYTASFRYPAYRQF